MKVLIVEDDPAAARLLRQAVTEAGYAAVVEENGETALARARETRFSLILLDRMLPGRDGLSVCRSLRTEDVSTPVLFLTALDTLDDKVSGLDAGADDYLVKPFRIAELLARMRALLRRRNLGPGPAVPLQVADLVLDTQSRQARRGERAIPLSATEYRLLEYLMRNAGRVLTRARLLDHVWEYDFGGNDNVLEVYVSYLRAKIDRGQPQPLIHTVRGVGYRIAAPAPAAAAAD